VPPPLPLRPLRDGLKVERSLFMDSDDDRPGDQRDEVTRQVHNLSPTLDGLPEAAVSAVEQPGKEC
jgi:hypothetical protein